MKFWKIPLMISLIISMFALTIPVEASINQSIRINGVIGNSDKENSTQPDVGAVHPGHNENSQTGDSGKNQSNTNDKVQTVKTILKNTDTVLPKTGVVLSFFGSLLGILIVTFAMTIIQRNQRLQKL